jgi:glycosyltransferase involved in cell wall biosynthesis
MSMTGSQASGDEMPQRRVSVCVATCGRPIGLANLLGALEVLAVPAGVTLQVVVVDNDSSESARVVCDEVATRHAYSLNYVVEKRRGISFARNAALDAALPSSDFIAFIDDDELPEMDWLAELLRVQEYYRADVVTGPCLPRYVESPPRWIREFLPRASRSSGPITRLSSKVSPIPDRRFAGSFSAVFELGLRHPGYS